MFTKLFWKDTAERVVVTAAQAALGVFTAEGVDLANIDLAAGATVVGVAALASFLKALIASRKSSDVSPASLVG